jgi:hypothetical protein
MRLMDAFMAFPSIILAIAISSVLGASVINVILALSIAATPHTSRIVRASVLVVREMEYVEAARAMGASHARILVRHVLANAMAPLVVRMTYVLLWPFSSRRCFRSSVWDRHHHPDLWRYRGQWARFHRDRPVDHDCARYCHRDQRAGTQSSG